MLEILVHLLNTPKALSCIFRQSYLSYFSLKTLLPPFPQNSLSMEVEELEQNYQISLSVKRKRGTFGRLTVHWAATGSLADIYPTSGVVSKLEPPATLKDILPYVLTTYLKIQYLPGKPQN